MSELLNSGGKLKFTNLDWVIHYENRCNNLLDELKTAREEHIPLYMKEVVDFSRYSIQFRIEDIKEKYCE